MSYIGKPPRNTAWRNKVLKRLTGDVILYGKVKTSLNFAKSLTKTICKMIAWAKKDTLHARRLALGYLLGKRKNDLLKTLFTDLRETYKERNSGYTRIVKLGFCRGDNSLLVEISLV